VSLRPLLPGHVELGQATVNLHQGSVKSRTGGVRRVLPAKQVLPQGRGPEESLLRLGKAPPALQQVAQESVAFRQVQKIGVRAASVRNPLLLLEDADHVSEVCFRFLGAAYADEHLRQIGARVLPESRSVRAEVLLIDFFRGSDSLAVGLLR